MRNLFSKYSSLLTYIGIWPFWLSTMAIIFNFEQNQAVFVLRTYGSVIVSFISGIHWAISMKDNNHKTFWLLATSNIIALVSWGSILIQHEISGLILLTLALVFLFYIDCKLFKLRQVESWFIRLRGRATLFVVLSIIIAGIYLI